MCLLNMKALGPKGFDDVQIIASMSGYPESIRDKKDQEMVLDSMTFEQISESNRLAREWMEAHSNVPAVKSINIETANEISTNLNDKFISTLRRGDSMGDWWGN